MSVYRGRPEAIGTRRNRRECFYTAKTQSGRGLVSGIQIDCVFHRLAAPEGVQVSKE
jgi:hypothetical protein